MEGVKYLHLNLGLLEILQFQFCNINGPILKIYLLFLKIYLSCSLVIVKRTDMNYNL